MELYHPRLVIYSLNIHGQKEVDNVGKRKK